jgi:hypothetical protein
LQGTGRMIVVEIEAGLPNGNNPGIAERIPKPALQLEVPAGSVVRVYPRGGDQPWLNRREREGALGAASGFPDYHDPTHTGRPGTLEDIG